MVLVFTALRAYAVGLRSMTFAVPIFALNLIPVGINIVRRLLVWQRPPADPTSPGRLRLRDTVPLT